MNKIEIPWDVLAEACEDADVGPGKALYLNYSGRFMYGRTCLGFVGGMGDFMHFLLGIERADCGSEWSSEMANSVETDNMGRETIFYFPGIIAVDVPENDVEED